MSITADRKQELLREYRTHDSDSGSAEIQIAVLSERIANLTEHFKRHAKDNHSKRGLYRMISRRRRLLRYVRNSDPERYRTVIGRLGLRR